MSEISPVPSDSGGEIRPLLLYLSTMNSELQELSLSNVPQVNLREQVQQDITHYLEHFDNPKKALANLSKRSEIHIKTLRRLLLLSHNPSYQTLYKLYSVILGANNVQDIIAAAPAVVRAKLKKNDPQVNQGARFSYLADVEAELQNDRVFAELYVLADTAPFTRLTAQKRFGEYGLEVLHKMLDMRVVHLQQDGTFVLGSRRASFGAATIKKVGLQLTQSYSKPENTDINYANHMSLYFESISEVTLRKWIDIDEKAFKEKLELLKQPGAKGAIPAYTFSSTDTLKEPAK
ncbi:hypothetical protein [Bdellovibrio sp. NC01]|uniref:hypothetical protein n=1 Tax=Bdellovibrio sp. NC01 TaxID=2220073 RepID=UPI001FF04A5A|nr:hypothetical protein [Bdellovibrio sp. NC01]